MDVGLGILPLFHSFGQTAIQNAFIIAGAKVVLVPQFEPKKALLQIAQHKVSFIAAVPTMFHLLLQHQKRNPVDVSSLRSVLSGGASLPLALAEEFQKVFGIVLPEGYGLSETSPITNYAGMGNRGPKPGSIGPQITGTHVRIMRDDGTFAEPDEIGELVVRGHNLMKGYYKDRLATQAVMHNDWFRTGDVAKADADGYFFIVDRKKDVIIRAGMNIYPREIEEVMLRHPAVKEISVIGVQDDTLSENVVAFVVLAEGESCTSEVLLKYCREHLAPFKCPKTVRFVEALPKGPTGKILKRELRQG
jgi:long-chain acyl-CoA synthetase